MPDLPQGAPLLLLVLDGWGHAPLSVHNAIAKAKTPFWDKLWQSAPHVLLEASGAAVGLPKGQIGNSEVGHLHLGAGRVVPQSLTRISSDIASGAFFKNTSLLASLQHLKSTRRALHVLGLLSDGGVHSHLSHIQALIALCAKYGLMRVYLHAFLDGRDTPPRSAQHYLSQMEAHYRQVGCGQTVSLIGRYDAMDRDNRWERTQKAFDLITQGICDFNAPDAFSGLEKAYDQGFSDEFVPPIAICPGGHPATCIQAGDAVIFMNFRPDRARQVTRALTEKSFAHFKRAALPPLSQVITLTSYASDIPAKVIYSPQKLPDHAGACIARAGYRQLRLAETEKYAHVTCFFNGGQEAPDAGEERQLIPSPQVATYDLAPGMRAHAITDALLVAISSQKYAFILCNFANPDMLGHTGNFQATVAAIEAIDACLARICPHIQKAGGQAIITADHGNAECLFDPKTGQAHTAHTTNLVPAVYVGNRPLLAPQKQGALCDVAPTLLTLLGIPVPARMTGRPLFTPTP